MIKYLIRKYVKSDYTIPTIPAELKYPKTPKEHKYLDLINELMTIMKQDPMTGVMHKEHFKIQRQPESQKIGMRDVYIMIDGDGLKKLNDKFGHAAGSAAILALSNGIKSSLRPTDMAVTRFGGDEFLVHIKKASIPLGVKIANRILENIRKQKISTYYVGDANTKKELEDITLTASLGVGYSEQDADKALYKAKGNGRNRVDFFAAIEMN